MSKVKTLNENDVIEHERVGKVLAQLGVMLNGRYGAHSMADLTYQMRYLNELRTDLAKLLKLNELISQLMDVHPMTDEPGRVKYCARFPVHPRKVSQTKRTEYFLSARQMRRLAGYISVTVSEVANVSEQLHSDAGKLDRLIKRQSSA